MRFSSIAAAGGVGAVCLLLASCVGGRPIHYYTINPPASTPVTLAPDGPVLLIGRITTPEALQDGRIRYRAGSNEVGAYEYHRWSERPAVMVQNHLFEALRGSGKFRQVMELTSAVNGDYVVRGKLSEFAEVDNPGIQTRLSLRLEVVDQKIGGVVWAHDYHRDEPVDGKTMNEVVLSMERNLQQVINEAVSAIKVAATPSEPRL